MREISEKLKKHFEQSVLTITKCWKVMLKDGSVFGFTSHDQDVFYEGINYCALTGFDSDFLNSSSDIECDEGSVVSILDSDFIKEEDIFAGRYDNAEVEIFIVNYKDLLMGRVLLFKGYLGNIKCEDGKFFGELRGLLSKLEKKIGDVFSPMCRVGFCSDECGLLISEYRFNGTVLSVVDRIQFSCDFVDIKTKPQKYFDYGVLNFLSGENEGVSIEVKQFNSGRFILSMDVPYNIRIGDEFEVIAGCDKNFLTCCEKFNNAVNFRGEPHLPGMEFMLQSK